MAQAVILDEVMLYCERCRAVEEHVQKSCLGEVQGGFDCKRCGKYREARVKGFDLKQTEAEKPKKSKRKKRGAAGKAR